MTNKDIMKIAMQQSAADSSCDWQDFCRHENKVVISLKSPNARKYLEELPFYCDLTSYGYNIVASVNQEIAETVSKYINQYDTAHCFEKPICTF